MRADISPEVGIFRPPLTCIYTFHARNDEKAPRIYFKCSNTRSEIEKMIGDYIENILDASNDEFFEVGVG